MNEVIAGGAFVTQLVWALSFNWYWRRKYPPGFVFPRQPVRERRRMDWAPQYGDGTELARNSPPWSVSGVLFIVGIFAFNVIIVVALMTR